jgi:hypothetical protein
MTLINQTDEHYEVAKRMLELYNNKFEDFVGYNELKRLINQNKDD